MNDTNQAPATPPAPPKTMTGKEICQALWKILGPMIFTGVALYAMKAHNKKFESKSQQRNIEVQQTYERR